MQACTGECVIVATAGVGGAFYFTPITFAPPSVPAAGTPRCNNEQVAVSDTGGGGAAGHENQVLVFTNDSRSVCTLTGYPGVAGLNSAGQQAVQAHRSLGGYMGGLAPGVTALPWWPWLLVRPRQPLSREGTDNPLGSQPCPHYPALLVTPPRTSPSRYRSRSPT